MEVTSKNKKSSKIFTPRILLFLTIVCIVMIALSIYFEYKARQDDYLKLLNNQAVVFINTISRSTQNAITAAEKIEEEINSRILTNLKIIERLDQNNKLNQNQLDTLLQITNVEAIQLYNNDGKLIQKSVSETFLNDSIPLPIIKARSKESSKDTILTFYNNQNPERVRLAAIIRRQKGGLIAAIIGKDEILSLRKILGIGYFLKRFQAEENIKYVVIQNKQTIVAGSFKGYSISPFSKDPFLESVLTNNKLQSRIIIYDEEPVFETISPFELNDQSFGILRLGLSMEEYVKLKNDVNDRLYIFAIVLIVFGFIFVNFFINYRHRKLLNRDLEHLQKYTNTILDNLVSGVISINQKGYVQSINKQALQLLDVEYKKVIYQQYTSLPSLLHNKIKQCLNSDENLPLTSKQWLTDKKGNKRLIEQRTNPLIDGEDNKTCVLLIDDITEQTRLEEQIKRVQRLTAMKNLASSVAHEIKNPLNAIKLIMDLIRKKYKPTEGEENYFSNLETVQGEIKRISTIVEQYLQVARPPNLTLTTVEFPDLISEVSAIFESSLQSKNITLKKEIKSHPLIKGDVDQLKQIFINLIKNAEEAIEKSGEILLIGESFDSHYEIKINDTGKGISIDDLNAIFDFHFTTKKGGSGIGLFVVQQIISAHKGKIDVESSEGKGTTFILQFPFESLDSKN